MLHDLRYSIRSLAKHPSFTAISQEDFNAGNSGGIGASRFSVSPGYFRAMAMSLLAGRDFDERDTMTTPRVAIVSESIARRLWPGRDAVGRFVAARTTFRVRTRRWNGSKSWAS